jgi:NADH-quinone oxidoreductase subunit M
MQKDLKRLVAYSSVAHLGFIVLGTFALTTQGLQGGLLQMVNHGLSTGALFLLVGMVYERRHTRLIADFGGLQKVAPIFAGVFMLVMLSSIGLPGLNGFVGEFLILLGTFITRRWWAVAATAGVILAAVYLLWAYQRVFQGVPVGDNATMPDMTWRDRAVMAPLLILIVLLGVYPKPALDRIQPSVDHLLAHVAHVDTGLHVPKSGQGPVIAVSAADNVDGPLPAPKGSQAAAGAAPGGTAGAVGSTGTAGAVGSTGTAGAAGSTGTAGATTNGGNP